MMRAREGRQVERTGMADDEIDDETDEEELDEVIADDDAELDPDELDEDFEELEEDDEFGDDDAAEGDDDEDEAGVAQPRRRAGEDEDEDEDLLAPDDVEADLDTILKDRLVAAAEEGEDEDEEVETDDRGSETDRLQPKRADETLCKTCFLLVRRNAPGCPVGDDTCPLFTGS